MRSPLLTLMVFCLPVHGLVEEQGTPAYTGQLVTEADFRDAVRRAEQVAKSLQIGLKSYREHLLTAMQNQGYGPHHPLFRTALNGFQQDQIDLEDLDQFKMGNNIVDRLNKMAHTKNMESPDTLRDAIIWFADFEHCRQFMIELRWADAVVKCPRCGSDKILYVPKERVWKCYGKHDHAKFSLKTGTIFEDSPIALEKWLPAAWLLINCKNGISSYELHRGLKVTQKTAWFMLHRIRLAMQDGGFSILGGEVEVDETFIGGKARNMHKAKREEKIKGRGPEGKEIVFGMVERGGNVVVEHVGTRKKKDLQPLIRERVEAGSAIFSDELKSYSGLESDYQHAVIDHAVEYVNGNVHTNTMENFWSLLKRGLHGTYISVEPFHLFRYIDEQAFRYNNRHLSDAERFASVMKQIVGRRITYKELTGKTGSDRSNLLPGSAKGAENDSVS